MALDNLEVNDTVFVKNELSVAGVAKINGFVNDNVPIELLFETVPGEMHVVGQSEIKATEDGQNLPVEVNYVPQSPGEYKVTLRAVSPPGDVAPANNELSTFVTVRKGGIVSSICKADCRWRRSSFCRALETHRSQHAPRTDRRPEQRDSPRRPSHALRTRQIRRLSDRRSRFVRLRAAELQQLTKTVTGGAGLMMLGGLHSFGPGGYQTTPLAEILPIEMLPLERQHFGEPTAADLHIPGPIGMQPTVGEQLRIMLLAPVEKNRSAWAELPPLDGANRFRGLGRQANVLAESNDASQAAPLLVGASPRQWARVGVCR